MFFSQGAAMVVPWPAAEEADSAALEGVAAAAVTEAARNGHAQVLQLLCAHGADPALPLQPGSPSRK